jgi:GT2 family glycosyltransferase
MRRLGAVILAYNSDNDLPEALTGLLAQRDVLLDIVVVDNASSAERLQRMRNAFLAALPAAGFLNAGQPIPADYRAGDGLFVSSSSNDGYSAGNNIGARIATDLGCAAVLIVNPDVRISRSDYLSRLADALFQDDGNAVAGSAIINLAGQNENPMFEPGFVQELLAPLRMLVAAVSPPRRSPSKPGRHDGGVFKLSGCCFLVRSTFLEGIGYFDRNVFLYCEEAILAAQVRMVGMRSVYVPMLEALHAHRSTAKGDPVRRQRLWSRSRQYYNARYLGYGPARLAALALSHEVVVALTWARRWIGGHR